MLNEVKHLAYARNWGTNVGGVPFVSQILRCAQDDRLRMAAASFVLPAAQRLGDSQCPSCHLPAFLPIALAAEVGMLCPFFA
jgi:hypothetical protein